MTKMHWLDETIWLIERYGYARREGSHQGKDSAEWMASIREKLESVSQTLDDLQTVYRQDRDELARARGWSTDDEAMAFGKDE